MAESDHIDANDSGTAPVSFSPRQREVARLIAKGYTDAEIASELAISPRTVRAHTNALRTKLAITKRRLIPAAYVIASGEDIFSVASHVAKSLF